MEIRLSGINKITIKIVLVSLILSLSGCVGTGKYYDRHWVSEELAAAGPSTGYIIGTIGVKVSGEDASQNNFSKITFKFKNADLLGRLVISQSDFYPSKITYENDGKRFSAFCLPVPPGEYELVNTSYYYNNGVVESSYSSPAFAVAFVVEENKRSKIGKFTSFGLTKKNMLGIAVQTGAYFTWEMMSDIDTNRAMSLCRDKIELETIEVKSIDVPPYIISVEAKGKSN